MFLTFKFFGDFQTCIAPDYVLCSKATQEVLVSKVEGLLKEWYGQDAKESPDLCRIVSERHFDRLTKLLETSSGKVRIGKRRKRKTNKELFKKFLYLSKTGGKTDRSSLYIDPTLITDVDPSDPIMQEEIFGPILPFVTASSPGEAIGFVNAREKPLVVYLFTEDSSVREKFASETSSGALVVNETMLQMGVESIPFGGVGSSGMGAYHGEARPSNTFPNSR